MRGNKEKTERLVQELIECLDGSVSKKDYADALAALARCRDIIMDLRPHIKDKKKLREVNTYCGVLAGFLDEVKHQPTIYITSPYWKGPEDYLRRKGILK